MTQIKVYIPSLVFSKLMLHHTKAIEQFTETMLREYGGMSVYDALGYWVNMEGKTEKEKVKVYEIMTLNTNIEDIIAIIDAECKKLKSILEQQTVMFCIDNKPYFV